MAFGSMTVLVLSGSSLPIAAIVTTNAARLAQASVRLVLIAWGTIFALQSVIKSAS